MIRIWWYYRKCLILLVLCFIATIMAGCECQHQWAPATCSRAQYCTKCGLENGIPLNHDWLAATCTTPKKCSLCGREEGSRSNTHHWRYFACTLRECWECGTVTGSTHIYGNYETATKYNEALHYCINCGSADRVTVSTETIADLIAIGSYDASDGTYYPTNSYIAGYVSIDNKGDGSIALTGITKYCNSYHFSWEYLESYEAKTYGYICYGGKVLGTLTPNYSVTFTIQYDLKTGKLIYKDCPFRLYDDKNNLLFTVYITKR